MTKRKLKDWVIPALSVFILIGGIFTYTLISKLINYSNPEVTIPTVEINSDETLDVDNDISDKIIRPYLSEKVIIDKYYYESSDTEERQVKSLIKYENIYMPNTGIMYTSDEQFDVISSTSGKITNIKEDELLGTIVEIENNDGLLMVYESITNVTVKVGDEIEQGYIIGQSNTNKIENEKYCLHFEVYKDNNLINPEDLFEI